MTREQLAEVEQALLAGTRANGFPTDLWTLPRVAQVIERLTGVAHDPGHVWRLLRGLGWSVQRPARRAAERDDQAVEQWVKVDWPRIKRGSPTQGDHRLLRRVRGVADPGRPADLGATGSDPGAAPPVQLETGLDGGRAMDPPWWWRDPGPFHIQPGSYNTDTLIVALGELSHFLAGEKATLLWDRLPAHRSNKMRAWVNQQRSWLVVERLPAYAPDLNPVEGLWSHLKGVELANLVTDTLGEIIRAAHAGIDRIRRTPNLAYGFLHGCGLKAW